MELRLRERISGSHSYKIHQKLYEYIPTILVGITTGVVAIMTYFLYKATQKVGEATKQVAQVTKETAKIPIMPRVFISGHTKIGEDDEHDHYEFIFQNRGNGSAFDLVIEIEHKGGSTELPVIPLLDLVRFKRVNYNSVDKGAKTVRFILIFYDSADHLYKESFDYDISEDEYSSKIERIVYQNPDEE